MTSEELKESQNIMEEKVYRIWTVLSAFEGWFLFYALLLGLEQSH